MELCSGTRFVGEVTEYLGYEVTSLDLKGADMNCDTMSWGFIVYKPGHLHVVWASPPFNQHSTVGLLSNCFDLLF